MDITFEKSPFLKSELRCGIKSSFLGKKKEKKNVNMSSDHADIVLKINTQG